MRRKKRVTKKNTKSNTWALFAAVLVAVFSLLFNHLFRITPEKIDVMRTSVSSLQDASQEWVATLGMAEPPTPEGVRSLKQVEEDLVALKPLLQQYFAAFVDGQQDVAEKALQSGNVLRSAREALAAQDELQSAEKLRPLQLLLFEGFFLAAGILPQEFTQDLEETATELLAEEDLASQEPFHLFLAYHQLGVHSQSDDDALATLQSYSDEQADQEFAIKLYTLVAQGMDKYGRRELSQKILRQGMDVYAEHEQRGLLVNVLIDQKIEDMSAWPH